MRSVAAVYTQNKNSRLAAEGIIKMAHSRCRVLVVVVAAPVLRQVQLRAYDDMHFKCYRALAFLVRVPFVWKSAPLADLP